MRINKDITFKAKPGANILYYAHEEFGGNMEKIKKFTKLYSDTFSKNLDENTVVDLKYDNKYIFSNALFPGIEYVSNSVLKIKEGVLQSLLQDCPKTLARIEVNLFRKIITENIKNGASIEELFGKSRKIKNEKSRKNFQDNLDIAKFFLEENSGSEPENWDFDAIAIQKMQKEAQTPGTELYELIHNFDKLYLK